MTAQQLAFMEIVEELPPPAKLPTRGRCDTSCVAWHHCRALQRSDPGATVACEVGDEEAGIDLTTQPESRWDRKPRSL